MLNTKNKILLSKSALHLAALIPLCIAYYKAILGLDLADPVEYIIHFTGMGAINLLIITLTISPAAKWLKQAWLMQLRRPLGLYAFAYALFHIINFWLFELNFNVALFLSELIERPYIWLGITVFIILLALALTSPNKIRAKMGHKWQSLHNLTYLAILLAWGHFYWSVKATPLEPVIYIALIVGLLAIRLRRRKKR